MPFIGKQSNSANSKINKYSFTVSGNTQNFSVLIAAGDEIQVFLNGVLLQDSVDYTYTSSQVSLTANAVTNDIVDIHIYQSFVLAGAVTPTELTTSEATSKATSVAMSVALGG